MAPLEIQGAGRTDAGVHARAQVAHLRVRQEGSMTNAAGLSRMKSCGPSIAGCLPMSACWMWRKRRRSFHARHDAVARTYIYQISTRRTAFFKKFVWWVKEPLDVRGDVARGASS